MPHREEGGRGVGAESEIGDPRSQRPAISDSEAGGTWRGGGVARLGGGWGGLGEFAGKELKMIDKGGVGW